MYKQTVGLFTIVSLTLPILFNTGSASAMCIAREQGSVQSQFTGGGYAFIGTIADVHLDSSQVSGGMQIDSYTVTANVEKEWNGQSTAATVSFKSTVSHAVPGSMMWIEDQAASFVVGTREAVFVWHDQTTSTYSSNEGGCSFNSQFNSASDESAFIAQMQQWGFGPGTVVGSVPTTPTTPATFSASPTSGSAPLMVTFTSPWGVRVNAQGMPAVGLGVWIEFGDGAQQSLQCPPSNTPCSIPVSVTHTYAQAGTYTASVKSAPVVPNPITTTLGTVTISVTGGAYVVPPPTPSPIYVPPTPPIVVSFNTDLRIGSRGSAVISMQQFLISQGLLASDSATGYFGPLTLAAVQSFQQQNNISPVSGFWGPLTRARANVGGSTTVDANAAKRAEIAVLLTQLQQLQARIAALNASPNSIPQSPPQITPPPLSTNFSASPTTGSAPLAVNFTVNNLDAHFFDYIDYGDGQTYGQVEQGYISNPINSHIYSAAGTYTALLKQASNGCYQSPVSCTQLWPTSWSTVGNVTITVNAAPPTPSCTISVNPTTMQHGGSATLTYSMQNATNLNIAGVGDSGASTGSTTVSPTVTSTYYGTATGPNGQATCSALLTVQ